MAAGTPSSSLPTQASDDRSDDEQRSGVDDGSPRSELRAQKRATFHDAAATCAREEPEPADDGDADDADDARRESNASQQSFAGRRLRRQSSARESSRLKRRSSQVEAGKIVVLLEEDGGIGKVDRHASMQKHRKSMRGSLIVVGGLTFGMMAEFIQRYRVAARKERDAQVSGTARWRQLSQLVSYLTHLLQANDMEEFVDIGARSGYNSAATDSAKVQNEYIGELLLRERLCNSLMLPLTREMKERHIWPRGPSRSWKTWGEMVAVYKKRVICLRAEVDNWVMRFRLIHNTNARELGEAVGDRQRRLRKFWVAYHDLARSSEPPRHERIALNPPEDADAGEEEAVAAISSTASGKYGICWDSWASKREGSQRPASMVGSRGANRGGGGAVGRPGTGDSMAILMPGRKVPAPVQTLSKSSSLGSVGSPVRSPMSAASRKSAGSVELPPISPNQSKATDPNGGRHRYLQECDLFRRLPLLKEFLTGDSWKLDAHGLNLSDGDLLTMTYMLPSQPRVVNMSGCALLTDRGLAPFLRALMTELTFGSLKEFNVAGCTRAGIALHSAIVDIARNGLALRHLDISHVILADRFHLQLCEAIEHHPCLESATFAETGMKKGQDAQNTIRCMKSLMRCKTLECLDLSWNVFDIECFKFLGECLSSNKVLRALRLAACSAAEKGQDFDLPIAFLIEWLGHNESLTRLDLSMNRLDFRTMIVLEDALEFNTKLKWLSVSNNPMGMLGVRSALRLLASKSNKMEFVDTDECYSSGSPYHQPEDDNAQVFSLTNPGGRYRLWLRRPYHRSLLRMVYKSMNYFGLTPQQSIVNLSYSEQSYTHPTMDGRGLVNVARSGRLKFIFTIEQAFASGHFSHVGEADFEKVLEIYYGVGGRISVPYNKIPPLFGRWKQLHEHGPEQRLFLSALAKDLNLSIAHLEHMCETSPSMRNEVMWHLAPCIPFDQAYRYLGQMNYVKFSDLVWVYSRTTALVEFNCLNPTGHYHLDLYNCCDYAVAERLLLIDRWESYLDTKLQRIDTSMNGNKSHFRNEYFKKRSLTSHQNLSSLAEWVLPEEGELELDYSSNTRAPQGKQAITNELFEQMLVITYEARCSPQDKVKVLRQISHLFFVSSMCVRQLIGYFRESRDRAEAFITFYNRIVDLYNTKLFKVRFETDEELVTLKDRLGYASFFPFIQPENTSFELHLEQLDQRLCTSLFIRLNYREKSGNLRDCSLTYPDGRVDHFTMGIKRGWENVHEIPKEGVFRGTYVCAPEDRNMPERFKLAESYGFWKAMVSEEEVNWWTGLTEVPKPVLDFVEWLIGAGYENEEAVFLEIDGADGNGAITLREFEDGLLEMGCTKFDSEDPKDNLDQNGAKYTQIKALFRYLDPGGEGSVSAEEFHVIGQLWKEFEQSVREFVHFLQLSFGDDDLEFIWNVLDEDDSGELTEEEWMDSITDIGYFGPARIVFRMLDYSGDGSISWDEFEVLDKYFKREYIESEDEEVTPVATRRSALQIDQPDAAPSAL